MKTYQTLGGGSFSAESNEDIVKHLNMNSLFGYRKRLHDFIVDTAKACKIQTGAAIQTIDFDVFVKDLLKEGFLKEVIE